jgi:hypothetical protein
MERKKLWNWNFFRRLIKQSNLLHDIQILHSSSKNGPR